MSRVQMMLQGKGGVGKSTTAALLAQFKKDGLGLPVRGLDLDPQNRTFSAWTGLGVEHIDLRADGDIAKDRFDGVMDAIFSADDDIVVDTGANGFLSITSYMMENDIAANLSSMGRELQLHTVIVGGEAMQDALDGLEFLNQSFPGIPIVAWLNPLFGAVEEDGVPFAEMPEAKIIGKRLSIVDLPNYAGGRASTFGRDLQRALVQHLTFSEAREAFSGEVMVAWRMEMMQDRFFEAIAAADPKKALF